MRVPMWSFIFIYCTSIIVSAESDELFDEKNYDLRINFQEAHKNWCLKNCYPPTGLFPAIAKKKCKIGCRNIIVQSTNAYHTPSTTQIPLMTSTPRKTEGPKTDGTTTMMILTTPYITRATEKEISTGRPQTTPAPITHSTTKKSSNPPKSTSTSASPSTPVKISGPDTKITTLSSSTTVKIMNPPATVSTPTTRTTMKTTIANTPISTKVKVSTPSTVRSSPTSPSTPISPAV